MAASKVAGLASVSLELFSHPVGHDTVDVTRSLRANRGFPESDHSDNWRVLPSETTERRECTHECNRHSTVHSISFSEHAAAGVFEDDWWIIQAGLISASFHLKHDMAAISKTTFSL